jgi:hypothetical protein
VTTGNEATIIDETGSRSSPFQRHTRPNVRASYLSSSAGGRSHTKVGTTDYERRRLHIFHVCVQPRSQCDVQRAHEEKLRALVLQWRAEEQQFRAWLAWIMERPSHVCESGCLMDICETDRWMDEVAHLQDLLVTRDLPSSSCEQANALLRLRRAHLFYPMRASMRCRKTYRCAATL